MGITIRSYVRDSYWLPVIGSSLTLTAPDIAGIHTFALTEGLFIFLLISGLVLLSRFIETKRRPWLIGSAAVVAMAFLTRYVGVTLVFTGVLVLLFMNGRGFRRIYLLSRSRNAVVSRDYVDDAATDAEGPGKRRKSSPLVLILLVFMVCYVAFLIFTTSFIDADTVLDDRALVPRNHCLRQERPGRSSHLFERV